MYLLQKFIKEHKPSIVSDEKLKQKREKKIKTKMKLVNTNSHEIHKLEKELAIENANNGDGISIVEEAGDVATATSMLRIVSFSGNMRNSVPIASANEQVKSNNSKDNNDENNEDNDNNKEVDDVKDETEIDKVPTAKLLTLLQADGEEDIWSDIVAQNIRSESSLQVPQSGSESKVNKEEVIEQVKYQIAYEIQTRLFNETYKLPYCFKYVSIVCIILWSLICAIITTLWCIWFEVNTSPNNTYESEFEKYNNLNCTNSDIYDIIPLKTRLNYNITMSAIDEYIANGYATGVNVYEPPHNDSWNDHYDVSTRFLLTVLLSYLLSVFLWQPLLLAFKSFWYLIKYLNNPNKINEGLLFYQTKFSDKSKQNSPGSNNVNDSDVYFDNINKNDKVVRDDVDVDDVDDIVYAIALKPTNDGNQPVAGGDGGVGAAGASETGNAGKHEAGLNKTNSTMSVYPNLPRESVPLHSLPDLPSSNPKFDPESNRVSMVFEMKNLKSKSQSKKTNDDRDNDDDHDNDNSDEHESQEEGQRKDGDDVLFESKNNKDDDEENDRELEEMYAKAFDLHKENTNKHSMTVGDVDNNDAVNSDDNENEELYVNGADNDNLKHTPLDTTGGTVDGEFAD